MESRAAQILTVISQIAEQARVGPLEEEAKMVGKLRYFREQLEGIYARHRKAPPEFESMRVDMQQAVTTLFGALEELEKGILTRDGERLAESVSRAREASQMFDRLEARAEDLEGSSGATM